MSSFITSLLTDVPVDLTDFTLPDYQGNCIGGLIPTVHFSACGGRKETNTFYNSSLFSWDF